MPASKRRSGSEHLRSETARQCWAPWCSTRSDLRHAKTTTAGRSLWRRSAVSLPVLSRRVSIRRASATETGEARTAYLDLYHLGSAPADDHGNIAQQVGTVDRVIRIPRWYSADGVRPAGLLRRLGWIAILPPTKACSEYVPPTCLSALALVPRRPLAPNRKCREKRHVRSDQQLP